MSQRVQSDYKEPATLGEPKITRGKSKKPGQLGNLRLFFILILGLTLGLIGVVSFTVIRNMANDNRLGQDGIMTTGEVLALREESGEESDRYYVSYRYALKLPGEDAVYFEREEEVSVEVYDHAEYGAPIDVLYLPADPSIAKIAHNDMFVDNLWTLFLAAGPFLFFFAIFIWQVIATILDWRNMLLFRSSARTAQAVITKLWESGLDSTSYHVAYRFSRQLPDGRPEHVFIEDESILKRDYEQLKSGDTVTVRYAAINPLMVRIEK